LACLLFAVNSYQMATPEKIMSTTNKNILTINGGSSSIKFALYSIDDKPLRKLYGKIDRIGLNDSALTATNAETKQKNIYQVNAKEFTRVTDFLIAWLEVQTWFTTIKAIGHRIVHGMHHTEAEVITQPLLDELKKISGYDPDHLPGEIQLIEAFKKRHPQLQQVACFDTAFHTTMPRVARMFPIPRRFDDAGIQRYGFHGISYSYIMQELGNIDVPSANARIIVAHLGSGASMVAVKEGKSIDTSMGFTPTGGFMMGSRPGDLDPGVVWYMMQTEKMTPEMFSDLINHQSGLLGVAETSADMVDLLKIESTDIRAKEAINLFCYQAKKWIGSFTAVLGGLDVLIFTGGIGENAPSVRKQIMEGLQFMGIEVDDARNAKNETVISTTASGVKVYVIPTNEELMIAKTTIKLQNDYGNE